MAEGGAADLETQRGEIAALLKTQLRKGDTWWGLNWNASKDGAQPPADIDEAVTATKNVEAAVTGRVDN